MPLQQAGLGTRRNRRPRARSSANPRYDPARYPEIIHVHRSSHQYPLQPDLHLLRPGRVARRRRPGQARPGSVRETLAYRHYHRHPALHRPGGHAGDRPGAGPGAPIPRRGSAFLSLGRGLLLHAPRQSPRRDPSRGYRHRESAVGRKMRRCVGSHAPAEGYRRLAGAPFIGDVPAQPREGAGKEDPPGRAPETRETGNPLPGGADEETLREGQDGKDRNPPGSPGGTGEAHGSSEADPHGHRGKRGQGPRCRDGGGPRPPACPEIPGEKRPRQPRRGRNPEKPRKPRENRPGIHLP